MAKPLETLNLGDAIVVEKIEENPKKTEEKREKTSKKSVKITKNEYISLLAAYSHPEFMIFKTIENANSCKMCGKSLNMVEKTLCPACFKENNAKMYKHFLNDEEVIELEK